MMAVFVWFAGAQIFGANERNGSSRESALIYQGGFVWEKSDGMQEQITVPGTYAVPAGETMVLITQLPESYREQSLMIRSSLQDVRFYVEDRKSVV